MAIQITAEKMLEITVEKMDIDDANYSYDGYTVYVGHHRILTIATGCDHTATKWLQQVLKRSKNRTIVVGVCVGVWFPRSFEKGGRVDSPFDLLQICTGSHCLLYRLPLPPYCRTPKSLQNFFGDRRVIAVGTDMTYVAKKLEFFHNIRVANAIDLKEDDHVPALNKQDRNQLDDLVKTVVGKDMKVARPTKKVNWYNHETCNFPWRSYKFTEEKLKYATLDPYLCFLIGFELASFKKQYKISLEFIA